MPTFESYDGTSLAYHARGEGPPLVCLPGGPGRASSYLGDLGGLSATRKLILLDNRGTGASPEPSDESTYRCDRLVNDVEALRTHLNLATMDLLAHSAAGNIAVLYAARHPDNLRRLVLVTPGLSAAGVEETDEEWHAALRLMSGEPWYEEAHAALLAWDAGDDTPENRKAAAPFFYGRWNSETAAHASTEDRSPAAAAGFETRFTPEETRKTLTKAPTLVIAGAVDPAPTPERATELAALFPNGRVVIDPASSHFPWITGPDFARTVETFLL